MLIVFEGIDGSGKTTLSRMFQQYLEKNGIPTLWLREPSDSPLGDKIRRLAQGAEKVSAQRELDLFIADRRFDVASNIVPALQAGKTVILDRYFYSNVCYQGARGLDKEAIIAANLAFAPTPDMAFVIDVDVDVALERIRRSRPSLAGLFEKKDFLKKVRANYLELSGPRLLRIDGNGDLESVCKTIIENFEKLRIRTEPREAGK